MTPVANTTQIYSLQIVGHLSVLAPGASCFVHGR